MALIINEFYNLCKVFCMLGIRQAFGKLFKALGACNFGGVTVINRVNKPLKNGGGK